MKPIKQFNINICRTEPEQVLKNKNDIEDLKNKEASDIINVNDKIDNINNKLAVDEENISKNADNIASNSYEISVLKPKVNKNINDIKVNSQAIVELNSKLDTTNNNVATNTEGISKLQTDNIQIKKDINQANANIRNVEDEASATALQMKNILNGNVIVPKANTATKADNADNSSNAYNSTYSDKASAVFSNFLTANSTNDDIEHAISHFSDEEYNQPIYFMQGNEYYSLRAFSDDYLIFNSSNEAILQDDNKAVETYPTFKKVATKWTFNLIEKSISPTINFVRLMYQGLGKLELHFELHSFYYGNLENLTNFKLVKYLTSLNQYNNECAMTTRFINGYAIQDGTYFLPIIDMEFNKDTGLFKIKYIENDKLVIDSDSIDLGKLTIEDFSTMYPVY